MNIHTEIAAGDGFARLGIADQLLKGTLAAGFETPKPIQADAIPPLLAGRDVLGIAQTGSGKTAAFALPILSRIMAMGARRAPKTAHALILAPTRELAVQIEETIRQLAKGAHISTALVLGGVSRSSQVKRLRDGVDILIATPGRLTDLVREGDVRLDQTRFLVLDEADRMLDMGFIDAVKRLARATHPQRQTALFSATMPDEIEALARGLMKEPQRIAVAPQGTAAAEIGQGLVLARTRQKRAVLSALLADPATGTAIVFARTKHGADKVARGLVQDGLPAEVIHGNKSQNARQRALGAFRDGTCRILVATDIAARGIDVPGIGVVVNYDLPDEPETYVHRIGRTGRNGASGRAVTLCAPEETQKLRAIERVIRGRIAVVADHTGEPDPVSRPVAAAPRGNGGGAAASAPAKAQPAGGRDRADTGAPAHRGKARSFAHHEAAHSDARKPQRRRRRRAGHPAGRKAAA